MTSIEEFIAELRSLGVALWCQSGELHYRAPSGVLNDARRCELKKRRAEVLDFVSQETDAPSLLTPLRSSAVARQIPLSYAQRGLWFLEQFAEVEHAYAMPLELLLEGSLDCAVLERAINRLVERHAALRARVQAADGVPTQSFEPVQIKLERYEACSGSGDESGEFARRWREDQCRRCFDLQAGPLLSASMLRIAAAKHLFILNMHHIVADGWSAEILYRELIALYEADICGLPPALTTLAADYADYARWQERWLAGATVAKQLGYWRQRLADAATLALPVDHARPLSASYRGAYLRFGLNARALGRLEEFGRQQQATLFMATLALFKATIFVWTAQRDILVGTPVAGRRHPQTEAMVGLFANMLVLRTAVSGSLGFRGLLQRVRQEAVAALSNQDVPFERLVEELQQARDPSRHPLFQVVFAWQKVPSAYTTAGGLQFRVLPAQSSASKFDLSLFVFETPASAGGERRLELGLEYSTDLFEPATVEHLAALMEAVLEAVVQDPDRPLQSLPRISEDARRSLLVRWNDTATAGSAAQCVHELFSEQARRTPDAVAVRCGEQKIGYAQLESRSNQLAHLLIAAGVRPESIVGLCMERSIEMVVAVLGVLKAGGAYLPLDPNYPAGRLQYMIEDAAAVALLTTPRSRHVIPAGRRQTIVLDSKGSAIVDLPSRPPAATATCDNLAYVIYTSGSTGNPKGVMVPHRGVINYLEYARSCYAPQSGAGAPVTTSLSFDATVTSLWGPLVAGSTVWLSHESNDLDALQSLLAEPGGFSLLKVTPAQLDALRQMLTAEQYAAQSNAIVVGGEALTSDIVQLWREHAPRTRIINEYGPTEAVVGCCTYEIDDLPQHGSIPIGRPIWNTQLYVLDQQLEPVAPGVAGELFIAGAGVTRGYLRRPAATAEKFLPNPFGEPGSRMYRTGDWVRFLPSGELSFLGRTDQQVKLRGYRIELGEIEAALRARADIDAAVVVVLEGMNAEKRLVAYVVAKSGAMIHPPAVRTELAECLPEYMVPDAIVELDALPLTPNGKVDRRSLAALPLSSQEKEHRGPRTTTEQRVLAIWKRVLDGREIGIDDHFFAIGGHSLLAARVIAAIRDVFSIELPLRCTFECPTVAALARRIDDQRRSDHPCEPIQPRADAAVAVPVSFEQEQLWFLWRLGLVGSAYNVPVALKLHGELSTAALGKSLAELVRRHESLRTRFESKDGSVRQKTDAPPPACDLLDWSDLPPDQAKLRLQELLARELQHKFDLATGPLFRASLARLGPCEHVLMLNLHHIICDGWSLDILGRELHALYSAYCHDVPPSLPQPSLQYGDFAVWQRSQGERMEKQLAYWKQQLSEAPPVLEMPTDHPRPAVASFRGATVAFTFEPRLHAALNELARSHQASLFMVLLAAYQLLLSRWSGQKDVLVGAPVAGRTRRELEDVVGYFVNTVVLRADLTGRTSFKRLLEQVRETALTAFANQEAPLEKVIAQLRVPRDLSRQALFQTMIVMESDPQESFRLPGLSVSKLHTGWNTAKVDLTLSISRTGRELTGSLEYATDLFQEATIGRFAEHLLNLLRAVAENPNQSIDQLPILGRAERREMLGKSPGVRRYAADLCVHELIERQAGLRPEAIAVSLGEQALTYRELNERANQLARYLEEAGARPDRLVGLCTSRSLQMIVGILGILKSGAGYLPLDPAYPAERLHFVINDCRPALILTEASLGKLFAAGRLPVFCLDQAGSQLAKFPRSNPANRATSRNLIYCIYTSGSTGTPKGALLTHGNVSRLFASTEELFRFDAQDVWTLFHSYAFDFSVWEIFGALVYGGRLVIVPFLTSRSPEDFYELLRRERVTVLNQTPSAFRQLITAAETAGPDRRLDRLRTVIFGGEALNAAALRPWIDLYSDRPVALINMYGITETTVHVTYRSIGEADVGRSWRSPIGAALADLQLYVLDDELEPVPLGVVGELYVAGEGLARGYHGRPGLTAERFIPCPFPAHAGRRLYKTGDLARWRADGELEYVGRADGQIKLRGHRIELREIEACFSAHPAVREAVVMLTDAGQEEQRLTAWVVGKRAAALDADLLRRHAQQYLPDVMVPGRIVVLEELPLTANGKLDRRQLLQFDAAAPAQGELAEPRSAAERSLAAVWAEILGVSRVGIHDNFFALGGDSIRAVQLVRHARIRGLSFTIADLFKHQSIAELAAELGSRSSPAAADRALNLTRITAPAAARAELPQGIEDAYLLSAMQEMMVQKYAMHAGTGAGVYHAQQLLHIHDAQPSAAAMADAVHLVVQAHPVLRTRFSRLSNGTIVQTVSAQAAVDMGTHDITRLDSPAQQQYLLEQMQTDREQPFGIEGQALLRVNWYRTGVDRFAILLSIHHAIDDGWGNQHLLDQLFRAYRELGKGQQPRLAMQPNVFKEYVALEHEARSSEAAAEFWRARASDCAGRLPARAHVAEHRAGAYGAKTPDGMLQSLMQLSAKLRVQLKAVLLDAYRHALRDAFGRACPTIGVVTNGRSDRLTDPLNALGLFWNLTPFYASRVDSRASEHDQIKLVQLALTQAEPFALYPLTAVAPARDVEELLFATFNFTDFHNEWKPEESAGLRLLEYRGHDRFHFPLNYLFAVDRAMRVVHCHAEYDRQFIADETVRSITAAVLRQLGRYTQAAAAVRTDDVSVL